MNEKLPWRAYVGLGANLPWQGMPPMQTLDLAVNALSALGTVDARSGWWRTQPEGPVQQQPAFVNGAAILRTALDPQALIQALLALEQRFGRVRGAIAKGPRSLDLDLLLMEHWNHDRHWAPVLLTTEALTLPHPELARRRFALAPLAEIAPQALHPLLGATVQALLQRLPAGAGVERMQ